MKCKLCDNELIKIITGRLVCPSPPSINSKWIKTKSHHYIFVPKPTNSNHYIEEAFIDNLSIQNFPFVNGDTNNCRIADYNSYQFYSNRIYFTLPFNLDLSKLKNLSEKEVLDKIKKYQLYL